MIKLINLISIQIGMILSLLFWEISCNNPTDSNDVSPTTLTDIDGNVYTTVKIGDQVWMKENLRVTKYNDGSVIPIINNETWDSCFNTPAYCYYNNTTNIDSIKKYGALYNWYVVSSSNPKKIAPEGWHVPTDGEWKMLQDYLIAKGYNWDRATTGNKIAKSMASKTDWCTDSTTGAIGCDLTKNNSSGFSAFPGGYRYIFGGFFDMGVSVSWWSVDDGNDVTALFCGLYSGSNFLHRSMFDKCCGFSIRLVRD
jgi:uncharacterized protein (TIGR02145 family)